MSSVRPVSDSTSLVRLEKEGVVKRGIESGVSRLRSGLFNGGTEGEGLDLGGVVRGEEVLLDDGDGRHFDDGWGCE